ncbi:IS4 family transposase [Fusibacter sp. JL298sf-3]
MKFKTIGKVLEPLNSKKVKNIIKTNNCDAYAKKLTTQNLIKLFVTANLKEHDGLRAISTDLLFDDNYQRYLKLDSISPSQLYRRLSALDTSVLQNIFTHLVSQLHGQFESAQLNEDTLALNIVDASVITKALTGMAWAKYQKTKAGVKLHLGLRYYGENALYPSKATVTGAKEHDVSEMLSVTDFTPGVINVYDRGYVDYDRLDQIHEAGGCFVVRMKSNSVTWANTRYDNPKGVLYASKGPVGSGSKKTRHEYHYIQQADDDGTIYHFLTNVPDLETDTGLCFEDVCNLYKLRWKIELFFKWLKQHSKVKHFFATDEVGAVNQIYLSLILYCLLALFKQNLRTDAPLNKIRVAIRASLYSTFESFKRKIMRLNPF